MLSRTDWINNFPLHPLLFSIYPLVALLAINIADVNVSLAFRPIVLSLVFAGGLWLAAYAVCHDWTRAAFVASMLLILFFSYGHVYMALKGISINGFYLFRHRTLFPLWSVLAVLSVWLGAQKRTNGSSMTYTMNVIGLFLLVLPMTQLLLYLAQPQTENENKASALTLTLGEQPPDIYYIILDGYGRSDVLKENFGYNNSQFLNSLRDQGFYIAECSMSNYAQTQISLSSSLNFNYLDTLNDQYVPDLKDRSGLDMLIQHNVTRESLEQAGYTSVTFATGFLATEWKDADYFLDPQYSMGKLNEFEALLLGTTLARLLQDGGYFAIQASGAERFRERTLFALDKMDDLSYIKGPKLVFIHLVIPHPPYVFGPDGGPVKAADVGTTRTQNKANRYRDQAIYISDQMRELIPSIIKNSSTPPIIILQGDHGPTVPSSPQARMSILNAYYLPGGSDMLYPSISPVNTFRVIFNTYFGQTLPLLEDKSLYSDYDDPFNFRVIQNYCKSKQ